MIRIICTECKNAYLQNKDKKLVCPSCGTSFDEEYENLLSGVQYYNEENFTECDNALMKFMSLFYQGRVYFNAKEYAKAMHSYLQAEKAVPYFDNDYLKGLLYTQMAYVYEEYYDYPKALKSYREAHCYYTKANLLKHSNYALYGIAAMYRSSSDTFEEAEQTLYDVVDASKLDNDSALMAICLSELIVHYVETKE